MNRVLACLGIALVGAALPASAQALPHAPSPWVHVLVTGQDATSQGEVVTALRSVGSREVAPLAVIHGVSATVPATSLAVLRSAPGVRSVTADAHGRLEGVDPTLGYDISGDEGSLFNVAQVTHAKDAWNKGWTGKGVDVALIDSGVVPVKGLTSGNVVNGPDLSFESQDADLLHLDTFGHGTHMASIIAGRDAVLPGSTHAKGDGFTGIAPDARVLSVKVAAADGGCDVSQVIAAIDWVAQHAHGNGLNVRVLNLSYGTDSTQDASLDPLDFAVENAWRAGIAVVVSSGNDGVNRAALADPANDPLVIAVGADDTNDTDSVGDDRIAPFTQVGTSSRRADVIAPGMHVLGLRNPGSSADQSNPSARVGSRFIRGTGTSQAAAVVSGLAAVYLQRYPAATPDQLKKALANAATVPSSVKSSYPGLGVPDVNKAIGAALPSLASSAQVPTGATGLGTLEGARGSIHVNGGYGALTGERDIFGRSWDAGSWATSSAQGTSWNGNAWRGETLAGDWDGSAWSGSAWSDKDWSGHAWSGHAWSGHAWSNGSWDGSVWSGSAWSSSAWSGSAWSGAWQTTGWQAVYWG